MSGGRTIHYRGYELDLDELAWRMRHDSRYRLGILVVAGLGLLLFAACGWLAWLRQPPTALLYIQAAEGTTLEVGGQRYGGPGPHLLPAGQVVAQVERPGCYPADLRLELAAGTTTTITPTLQPRPTFQEIAAGPGGSSIESVFLGPQEVRLAVVLTQTVPSAGSFEPVPAAPAVQWWRLAPDGRREHLLAMDAAAPFPAAWNDRSGETAMVHPGGLFVASAGGGITGPLITGTADVQGLAWWGQALLLARALPAGVQLELLPYHATATQALAALPVQPDMDFILPSPTGRYALLLVGGPGRTLLLLDRRGRSEYLADLPPSPLPWAFASWAGESILLWTAPQAGPDGTTTWPIYRLDLDTHESRLLDAPADVRGLWVEEGRPFYLDGQARVWAVGGAAPLYTIEEIDTGQEFALWRQGDRAVLYSGRYWLLTWRGL